MVTREASIQAADPGWGARPPPGWEPIGEMCRQLFLRLDEITAGVTSAMEREVADFGRPDSRLTRDDLAWSTRRNLGAFLHGVAENRPPTEEEISFRRLVGRRSAVRGVPLQALMIAFHVAYRELWAHLVAEADRTGGAAPALLLAGGSTVWQWMLATTGAVAEGHQQEMALRAELEARATAQFLDAVAGDPSSIECQSLARDLGFSPTGVFRVLALGAPAGMEAIGNSLVASLQAYEGVRVIQAQRGRSMIVVVQGADDGVVAQAIAALPEQTPLGLGIAGEGLAGARASMNEAERALEVAVLRSSICRFETEWPAALVVAHRASIERALSPGIDVVAKNPRLAEAVRTFAESQFSVAESARRLVISESTLRYRLGRWRDLTGWDPWSFLGLSSSLAALELAHLPTTR